MYILSEIWCDIRRHHFVFSAFSVYGAFPFFYDTIDNYSHLKPMLTLGDIPFEVICSITIKIRYCALRWIDVIFVSMSACVSIYLLSARAHTHLQEK